MNHSDHSHAPHADRPHLSAQSARTTKWAWFVAVGLVLVLVYLLRYVLLPFVAAGALGYVFRPVIRWLVRRFGWRRWAAALIIYVTFLCALSAIGYGVRAVVVPDLEAMFTNGNELLHQFLVRVFHGERITFMGQPYTATQLADYVTRQRHNVSGPEAVVEVAEVGFAVIMGFVLTLVLLGFFMFTGPALAQGILWLVPPYLRPRVRDLAVQIDPVLGRYLRGVAVIVFYTAAITWVVTGPIFHVPHAVLLALAVGVLELLPVVGPILSFIAFGLVAIQQHGFETIIGFGIFAVALRLSIDQLVGPVVLGRAARLPAVVIIFAFLAGGALYGILGVVLAIPFAAALKIVLQNLYERPSLEG